MADGVVKTQGTHLYFVDRTSDPAELVKLACPTAVTGLTGGAFDDIEDTCLDETDMHTFQAGLSSPVDITIPFNLIPRETSHQILFDMKDAKTKLDWVLLMSESATPPTLSAAPASAIVVPEDRSTLVFQGVIREVNIDFASNEIVRGTITVRRTSVPIPNWFVPA